MFSRKENLTISTYNKIHKKWIDARDINFWNKEYKVFQKYFKQGKILDLGCGGGHDAKWFASHGCEYIGIDASKKMIASAKKNFPKGKFFVQDFLHLKFEDYTFDAFWAICSLIHLPKSKIRNAIKELKRVIKPNAFGVFAMKCGRGERVKISPDGKGERFFSYYTKKEFTEIIENLGFKVLKTGIREPGEYQQDGTFMVFYVKLK